MSDETGRRAHPERAPLGTIAGGWTRIGVTGFGGPPPHIVLLRQLVVERRRWMEPRAFEDAIAACNLLPGPASTQLAIFCAYRIGGPPGAVIGGLGFVVPAVAMVLVLSVLFLSQAPPVWVRGAGAGAGAAVAAVAVRAGLDLAGPSLDRVRGNRARELRWFAYGLARGGNLLPARPLGRLARGVQELRPSRHLRLSYTVNGEASTGTFAGAEGSGRSRFLSAGGVGVWTIRGELVLAG